ncbi:MAG: DUF3108 domain-containing protein [Candidatus Omnitrophica bacterium]|nr:DUF3108 domain-containing protein [Candidatus Omnitrophota bacterium]MCG2703907.1 DUF3108 domain-containing protein [Candidatus Omnitrophota bacterium]
MATRKKLIIFLICFFIVQTCGCASLRKKHETKIEPGKEAVAERTVIESGTKPIIGEIFYYKVHWLGLNVGDASLGIQGKVDLNGRSAYHIIMRASTNKFFSFFYNVQGTVESYVDAKDFRPLRHNAQTIINNKKVFKKMDYDFDALLVYAEDKKGKYTVEIPKDVLDPLGVFYYFRRNSVAFDEPIELTINGGKKNFSVTVFVQDERMIHTPAGRFLAFRVKPTTQSERQFDDSLNAPGTMTIWFSADERHVPLLVTLKVPFGTAQAVLNKIQVNELTTNN